MAMAKIHRPSLRATPNSWRNGWSELLVSWDIVEDGEPLPPTKEVLMTFPNALLGHIVTAIGEDSAPKPRSVRR